MKNEQGLSIFEILLVIALAGLMLVVGIRQYQSYRLDADVVLIKYNTDALFSAMSSYFQANCGGTGSLSPYHTPPLDLTKPVLINITTDLVNGHYLNAAEIAPVSLVLGNAANAVLSGYQVRFVPAPTRVDKPAQASSDYPSAQSVGQVVIWTPEIMVQMQDPNRTEALQLLTQANDCVDTNWQQLTCKGAPALRFSHQISFSNHSGSSDYWIMNPANNPLREQQEHPNPMAVLSTGSAAGQFYTCGS